MTVIMTYHTLADREFKNNNSANKWRLFAIIILICISICGLVAAFKINALIERNYNGNCFVNAELVFRNKNDLNYNPRIRKFSKINEITTALITADTIMQRNYTSPDEKFFDTMIIDTYNTYWGHRSECEYISIAPLFSSCVATIWIAMFLICGSAQNLAPKPWRIVAPSAIFFIIMTIASFVHLIYLKITLDRFCDQIQAQLTNSYSWAELLDRFSILSPDGPSFAHASYPIIITLLSIVNILWLFVFVVMILRCIFVVDFQLVSTTVATLDDCEATKSTESFYDDCRDGAGVRFKVDREDDETSFVTAPQRTPSTTVTNQFLLN